MFNRRQMLTTAAAAGAIATTPGLRAAFAQAGLDPSKPEDLWLIHKKLNYTTDNRIVYWLIDAVRYGHFDYEFTPFWHMNVGMFFKVVPTGEFTFDLKFGSIIYYTDLDTGELLEEFTNPITGETIPVRQPGFNKAQRKHDLTGVMPPQRGRPGYTRVSYDGAIGPAWVVGDDVWCRADTIYRYEPTEDGGGPIQVNDWSTIHGSISEVSDPDVTSANATHVFNDVNTFPSWLQMGDTPGNYVSRGQGRKGWTPEVWTEQLIAIVADKHPEVFDDPDSALPV